MPPDETVTFSQRRRARISNETGSARATARFSPGPLARSRVMASNGSNDATAKETEAAQESFKRYVEPVRSRVFSSPERQRPPSAQEWRAPTVPSRRGNR